MKRFLPALLVSALLSGSCGDDDPAAVLRSGGERTAHAAVDALGAVMGITGQALAQLDPGMPNPMFAAVRPKLGSSLDDDAKTGFAGPVNGPDGATGWYMQAVTVTHDVQTATGSRRIPTEVRFFLRADPPTDLSGRWPRRIPVLQLAVVGVSGVYEGYRTLLKVDAESADRYLGSWEHVIEPPSQPLSYARFLRGTRLAGRYQIEKSDGFDPTWSESLSNVAVRLQQKNHTLFTQTLHVEDRRPAGTFRLDATENAAARTHGWFLRWQRDDVLDQSAAYRDGTTSLEGPATYRIVAYWGRGGADPEALEEPSFEAGRDPRGSAFAAVGDPATSGLTTWFRTELKTGADFSYTYRKDAPDDSRTQGTCSGSITVLRHDGGRCALTLDDCGTFSPDVYWSPPSACGF